MSYKIFLEKYYDIKYPPTSNLTLLVIKAMQIGILIIMNKEMGCLPILNFQ